jgi:hypothetical protein
MPLGCCVHCCLLVWQCVTQVIMQRCLCFHCARSRISYVCTGHGFRYCAASEAGVLHLAVKYRACLDLPTTALCRSCLARERVTKTGSLAVNVCCLSLHLAQQQSMLHQLLQSVYAEQPAARLSMPCARARNLRVFDVKLTDGQNAVDSTPVGSDPTIENHWPTVAHIP